MNRILYGVICTLFFCSVVQAQNHDFRMQNYKPASPTAFQFLQYTEVPVSEYTGIPQISIPLYEIEEDGVKIPLDLTYHAGGIRVSQEASWVGLGWDLQIGSIVQEINDEDDFGTGITSVLPDYHQSPIPENFPWRYNYPWTHQDGWGWSNPFPIHEPQPFHSYKVATAWWVPINGNFDDQVTGERLFTWNDYDSEPDIFRASFLGHSLSFIRDPKTKQIVSLNKTGYKITRSENVFKIIAPSGVEYHFETSTTVDAYSSQEGGLTGGSSSSTKPSSKIWVLTKIITNTKKQIQFIYHQTSVAENYPNYSEKWDKLTHQGSTVRTFLWPAENHDGYINLPLGELTKSYSFSKESRIYLSSIVFPKGEVVFTTSSRSDLLEGKKLDSVKVKAGSVVKAFQFNYSYFDATAVGGNGFVPYNASTFGNTHKLRLKLLSLQDNSGAKHNFTYNNTPLPAKNSFGQDYWGFYNGQVTNTTMVPNPARLKITHLADNGTNHSANLTYAQAGVLTEIQYPTGGQMTLEYGLNQFDNYWVPDFASTTNQTSTGNGLRVQSISLKANGDSTAKHIVYSYEGGKGIVPLTMYRQYRLDNIVFFSTQHTEENSYTVDEISAKGFFSLNSLGSINGVGYSKVIRQEVDQAGVPNGYTETYFNNTPDIVSTSAHSTSQIGAALPAIKDRDNPENGTVKEIRYFKSYRDAHGALQGKLIKKVINTYTKQISLSPEYEYYYGARIFSYGSLVYDGAPNAQPQNKYWYSTPRDFIGYYPIYDVKSMPIKTTTTEYSDAGDSLVTQLYQIYDNKDQLTMGQVTTSDGRYEEVGYLHPHNDLSNPMSQALTTANRLSEVVKSEKRNTGTAYGDKVVLSTIEKQYAWVGGDKILESKVSLVNSFTKGKVIDEVLYDKYDSATGRLLQLTHKGQIQSMSWGHKGNYLMAEAVNAKAGEIFFESFEEETGWDGGVPYFGSSSILSYDSTRSHTGRFSGKIEKPTAGEYYTHSAKWLNLALASPTKFTYSGWIFSTGPAAEIVLLMKTAAEQGYFTLISSIATSETNKWVYVEGEYTVPTNITKINIRIDNNGGGPVWFDDLRLHPTKAQMSTYTHIPLIGISSSTDINNRTTYYEYDGFGRLIHIRDNDQNILKKFCYNYQGQVEECTANASPMWQATGATRCKPCPQDTTSSINIQQHLERDINPVSPSYDSTRWVDDGVSANCSSPADWQPTGLTQCDREHVLGGSSVNTGNQSVQEVDINPCSPTYNTIRWISIGQNCTACPVPAFWQPTGVVACEKNTSNANTGYQLVEEKDLEPCSPTFNQIRTQRVYNPTACPLPITCTTSNCSGSNKKCINGVCETGTLRTVSSVYKLVEVDGRNAYRWVCTQRYCFSDGSTSTYYTETISTTRCLIQTCGDLLPE